MEALNSATSSTVLRFTSQSRLRRASSPQGEPWYGCTIHLYIHSRQLVLFLFLDMLSTFLPPLEGRWQRFALTER